MRSTECTEAIFRRVKIGIIRCQKSQFPPENEHFAQKVSCIWGNFQVKRILKKQQAAHDVAQ